MRVRRPPPPLLCVRDARAKHSDAAEDSAAKKLAAAHQGVVASSRDGASVAT